MINPPQSAILAVGRQRDCVVARDGGFVVRPLSDLTLTVDHRVADGRLAAQFLARLVAILEGRDWRLELELAHRAQAVSVGLSVRLRRRR